MQDIENITNFELIAKFLSGEADENEKNIVVSWIDAGNQSEFENIKQIWTGAALSEQKFDTEKALIKVNNRIKQNSRSKRLRLYSIAAAAIILLIAVPLLILNLNTKPTKTEYITKTTANKTELVQLADGSNITLNKNSSVNYPKDFSNNRNVTLEGEAFFEIEHLDKNIPFTVNAKNIQIIVVGTKFNVSAQKDKNFIEVTVTEGIVEVQLSDNSTIEQITAGQRLTIDLSNSETQIDSLGIDNDIYWLTNSLVFNNSDINEIASTISKAYNVEVVLNLSNPEVHSLTTVFENQDIEDVLNILELTLDLSAEKTANTIYITDAK